MLAIKPKQTQMLHERNANFKKDWNQKQRDSFLLTRSIFLFFLQLSLDLLVDGPPDLSNKVSADHDSPIFHLTPPTALRPFLVAIAEVERIVENHTKSV